MKLWDACGAGRLSDITSLIESKRVDINWANPNSNQHTCLMYSAGIGFEQVVKELLHHGADVNLQSGSGSTALMMAVNAGNRTVVQLLLLSGANVNLLNKDGCSALMFASRWGHGEIVRLLLVRPKPADPNVQSYADGETALMQAAYGGHRDVVRTLLQHGANVNTLSVYGRTAIMFAKDVNFPEIVALLVENGGDISLVDPYNPVNSMQVESRASLSNSKYAELHIDHDRY